MVRTVWCQLVAVVSLVAIFSANALAQQLPPPPPPPEGSFGAPVLPQPVQIPQPGLQPAFQPVPAVPPPPPYLQPAPAIQPLVLQPEAYRSASGAGCFAAFEIGVVAPSISGHLSGPVSVGGITATVAPPFADLDWTGSPRIELGYRFAGDVGAVVGAYRSVVSEGGADLYGFDPLGPAYLKTRLNLNSVDLMYASPDIALTPLWDLKWNAGVRIAQVYYDTRATGWLLTERASNNFIGAGPRVGLDARRYLEALPGLSLFGRMETGVMIGNDTQSYERVIAPGGTPLLGGASRFSETETSPLFAFQLGLSYSPPDNPDWVRFTFGYQFERWWGVGDAGNSSGDVQFQGLFFRGEFRY